LAIQTSAEVAADCCVILRRHVEDGVRRDSGIGVAAGLEIVEIVERGLRRERIARRDHAVAREHFGATLRPPALCA
jgi:hypothetical protein